MIYNKYLALTLVSLTLSGCVIFGEQSNSEPELTTRVYIDAVCPKYGDAETLGEIATTLFLEPLIMASIKGVGNAIKKAGEDKVTTVSGREVSNFYSLIPGVGAQGKTEFGLRMGCLTIVNGQLNKTKNTTVRAQQVTDFSNRYPKIEADDAKGYLSHNDTSGDTRVFTDDIRFFVQYKVVLSNDLTAMRLIPVIAFTGKRIGKEKQSKTDLVVISSIHTPSKSGTDDAFAIATSTFSNLQVNTYFEENELKDMGTGWLLLPAVPKSVTARVKANSTRRLSVQTFNDTIAALNTEITNESDATKKKVLAVKRDVALVKVDRLEKLIEQDNLLIETTPITMSVSLTETQKGNDFLVKFGTYLADNSAKIAPPLAEALDPTKRATAKAAEKDSDDILLITAVEAVASHQDEDAKLGNDRSESKIQVTKIKANQACRKLRAAGHDDVLCIGY